MTSPHLLLQHGEVMHKGIGLFKYWILPDQDMMYGYRATEHSIPES